MIIYRFRLTSEDQEDFFREIEIQPSQSFLDFHDVIMSCSDLMHCDSASFFTTDAHFKKKKEISLKKTQKQVKRYDEEMDEMVTETYIPSLMEKSKVKDFVEDPHQRMLYEFSGTSKFFFFLELFRIIKTEEMVSLPRCVSKKGELPKKMEVSPAVEEEEEEIPVPSPITAALFAGISEDESEISRIESNIEDILEEGEDDAEAQVREKGEMEEHEADEEDQIESLDEYEDLEDLENRSRGFSGETEEY